MPPFNFWNVIFFVGLSVQTVYGGLLDSLLGDEGQQRGRGLQQGYPHRQNPLLGNQNQNPQGNINLLNLFPQNKPINELDPETRETLTEQKGKLEDILANLKELNRLKDEQKQKELGNNGDVKQTTRRPSVTTTTTTRKPYDDSDDYKYVYNPNPKPKNNGWKTMHRKKFMFQVQPVRPQTAVEKKNETVYYLD